MEATMMKGPIVFHAEWLEFRVLAIGRRPSAVAAFLGSFSERDQMDFEIAARILDRSLRTGRPPSGRAERAEGSPTGLFELKVTPPGRRGPQKRLLYVRRSRTIWLVSGVDKRSPKLRRSDIEHADRIVKEASED